MTIAQTKPSSKPTPGRWHIESDIEGHFLVCDEQDISVARCYQQPFDTWKAEDNAHLIASAPELLQALQHARIIAAQHLPKNIPGAQSALDMYDRAIAKAIGDAP